MQRRNLNSNLDSFALCDNPLGPISVELCPSRPSSDLSDALKTLSVRSVSVTWHQSEPDGDNIRNVDALLLGGEFVRRGYRVLSHLPCRSYSHGQILKILEEFTRLGIRNVLALRGDTSTQFGKKLDGIKCEFTFAIDLLRFIRNVYGKYFYIGVAGYPEKHPDSLSLEDDLQYLKNKVEAGADFILTQAVFRYDTLKNFIVACRRTNIEVPIIPGIFLFSSHNQLQAMAKLASLKVPEYIAKTVSSIKDNDVAVQNFSVHVASSLIREMLSDPSCDRSGAKRIHLFSLNNLALIKRVYERLGLGNSSFGRYLGLLRSIDCDNVH